MERLDDHPNILDDRELQGNPYDLTGVTITSCGERWIAVTRDGHVIIDKPTESEAQADLERLRVVARRGPG